MPKIKYCQFNIDNACVELIYDNGRKLYIYTPKVEESLRTTVYSRSKMDLLLDNNPMEYVRMVLDGTMQEYVNRIDGIAQEQMKSYKERLSESYPPSIAEDIARELLMYDN